MKVRRQFIQSLYCFFADEGGEGGGDGGGSDVDPGFSAEIPTYTPEPTTAETFRSSIPEPYRDKPYMQGIDSLDKLYSQFDNAQQLIGKKTVGPPAADAPTEEWEKYYEAIRPETVDGYEFEKLELPEELKDLAPVMESGSDSATDKQIRDMFFKHGISAAQAKGLYNDFSKIMLQSQADTLRQNKEAAATVEKDFQEVGKSMFPDGGFDKVVEDGKAMLERFLPEQYKGRMNEFNGEALAVMTATLHNVNKAMGKEDTLGGETTANYGAMSAENLRGELRSLYSSPQWDPMHPDHSKALQKSQDIAKQIARIEAG